MDGTPRPFFNYSQLTVYNTMCYNKIIKQTEDRRKW